MRSQHTDSRKERVQFANTLRGIACLMVVIAHYCQLYWVAPDTVSILTGLPALANDHGVSPPLITRVVSFVPGVLWGNLGVAIFFLISGFVIPFSLTRLSAKQFLINRSWRIVPTYMAGFAVTVATIALACWCYGVPIPFNWSEAVQHSVPGLRELLKIRPIDGIVWTLEVEIKFYLLCALSAGAFRDGSLKVFVVPIMIGGIAIAMAAYLAAQPSVHPRLVRWLMLWIDSSQYLIFMYVGVVFHLWHRRSIDWRQAISLGFALLMLSFAVWTCGSAHQATSIPWNYGLAVILFGVAHAKSNWFQGGRLTDFLASISYPLYVVHGVAGYVCLRVFEEQRWPPTVAILVTFSSAVTVAWLIHRAIELPTQRLGKRLSQASRTHCTAAADQADTSRPTVQLSCESSMITNPQS